MENLAVAQSPSVVSSPSYHHPPSPEATPVIRCEPNSPYPTTFVQAETSSFKQVVQMLTGSTEAARLPSRLDPVRGPTSEIRNRPRMDKSGSKLYERRNSLKNFRISPLGPATVRPGLLSGNSGTPENLSPSMLDFPSLVLSPITPLIQHDTFHREVAGGNGYGSKLDKGAEEKAIKEKGFYLHPSPATTPRESEPRLLPLFPVTSPRVAASLSKE